MQSTNLTRVELIKVYTQFLAMFMLQEGNKPANRVLTRRELQAQKHLSFSALCEQSKLVKFQPRAVVSHLLGVMQKHNGHFEQHVNWQKFADQIAYLLPQTPQDKMTVFLRAIAPQELTEHDYLQHEFTRDEIIKLCREALHIMGTQDAFFEELAFNFAKYIY